MIFRLILAICLPLFLFGQAPIKPTSGEIHNAIKKLKVVGSVLYVAAHPDDENTRLISYLANDLKVNTTYLSLTRGDGGQNLIGSEISEKLGVIRTQELLAARKIDGGHQTFTRANDFGFSKHPDETFEIWNKKEVLSDVIWAIRKYRPDVIINRFDHRSPGSTHGHHTGSAMLSYEAFDMAGDPNVYPEQLTYVSTWQPKSLYFNTSWWFYGSQEKFEAADKSQMVSVEVGSYYPILGKSNTEIAALSRSMHKSQGFGSTGTRGSEMEYLENIKGQFVRGQKDLFGNIDLTCNRLKGGQNVKKLVEELDSNFSHEDPSLSIPLLLKTYKVIEKIDDDYWKNIKLAEIKNIIQSCMGLYMEAVSSSISVAPGDSFDLKLEMINRSKITANLNAIHLVSTGVDTILDTLLLANSRYSISLQTHIPATMDYSQAYWLKKKGTLGMYNVDDQLMRGLPESKSSLTAIANITVSDVPLSFEIPMVYKSNDPVKGEIFEPFEIVPEISVSLTDHLYLFGSSDPKEAVVTVKAYADNLSGKISLEHDTSWSITPDYYDLDFKQKGEETQYTFLITPPENEINATLTPIATIGNKRYRDHIEFIKHDHIPTQTIVSSASSKVARISIKKKGNKVAYIVGAGDEIPQALNQIGYQTDIIEIGQISQRLLESYDACIIGSRAYNTFPELLFKNAILFDYVDKGGTLIVQYNNFRRLDQEHLAPYPLKISNDRVTDENAEMRVLAKDHMILNEPNKITSEDFKNWVQERGLYFPNEWDEHYEAIFSTNDINEDPKEGSLLVAKYGKGYYIYTGISFFRQLPAGVPGAFRLFANMISLSQDNDRP